VVVLPELDVSFAQTKRDEVPSSIFRLTNVQKYSSVPERSEFYFNWYLMTSVLKSLQLNVWRSRKWWKEPAL